jgi:hypothetical protein
MKKGRKEYFFAHSLKILSVCKCESIQQGKKSLTKAQPVLSVVKKLS